jgi:hypothetical protein
MDTDWLPHGVINRMLTATSISDRVLGVSKVATVSTEVLLLGSGNNVGPLRDLARRVLTINLNARSDSPATLKYKGDPIAKLKAERESYVSAVLTIIEAWKAAGSPKTNVPSIASYGGNWADYCRHPLIWLGQPDPAAGFIEQIHHDPDADNLRRLLTEWYKALGDKAVPVRRLLDEAHGTDLDEALRDLPVVERDSINRSKLGHYLKRNRDRIIGGLVLQRTPTSERTAWRVVPADSSVNPTPSAPPLPAFPPSDGATCEIGEDGDTAF